MYCNDCSELIQHCRCSWFGGRHEVTTSSESREPKYKADDRQSSRFLTGRSEQTGSLGGDLMTPNVDMGQRPKPEDAA